MPNWNVAILGSSLMLRASGQGGSSVTILAAHQLRWYEIRRRRKSEGGQKFLPPNPLPFRPPERKSFSKFSVRIFAKKSSDFVQGVEPNCMFSVCCLGASRLSRQIV